MTNDIKKLVTTFFIMFLIMSFIFLPRAYANVSQPDFGLPNMSKELQTAIDSIAKNVVKTEDVFKGTSFTVPRLEMPKKMPHITIPDQAIDDLMASAKAFVISGMEISYHIVVPVIRQIMPETELPEVVHYALAASVFTIIMSMFVSIPKLLILAVAMSLVMMR